MIQRKPGGSAGWVPPTPRPQKTPGECPWISLQQFCTYLTRLRRIPHSSRPSALGFWASPIRQHPPLWRTRPAAQFRRQSSGRVAVPRIGVAGNASAGWRKDAVPRNRIGTTGRYLKPGKAYGGRRRRRADQFISNFYRPALQCSQPRCCSTSHVGAGPELHGECQIRLTPAVSPPYHYITH